ncbi:MAG: GAF domain-containing protein [Gemmatimonadetes bacterium]|nr:GAF domain-containing protein [Gemmatimonadota bacterium]
MSHATVDIVLYGVIAMTAAILLQRGYRMRSDLARQISRLETLIDISRVLLTDRNVRGVLRHVAESAARLVSGDMAHVTLVTANASRLVLEAATGPIAPFVGSAVPAEGSMAGWVIKHGQPLLVNDPASDPRRFRSVHDRIALRRAVMLPLVAKGRCVGALGVDNPRGNRVFSQADVELLRDLATYTALVIESLQAVDELGARERRAALLNVVNSRIRQSLELEVILDAAVRELGAALGVSRCFVRLRRGMDLLPTTSEWHGPDVPGVGGRPDSAQALLTAAVRERRTVETSDARTDPRAGGKGGESEGPLAVLATPIVLRGEAIGVIAFHQVGVPRLWREGEIGLVEEVADERAIAISNARLYRSVEDASGELASKISELERANRLKTQFLANMSHELRTPLNSVIGFSEMLLIGAHGPLTNEQRDSLETIARNGRHLLGLVNDVLDVSKIEAGRMELHLEPTDVRELVTDVLTGMESLVQAKGHRVAVELGDGTLVVHADEMRVRQVLFNLLTNAVKFTPPGGRIVVHAMRRRSLLAMGAIGGERQLEREVVRVTVTDTGIGIAPEDVPRLFTEFTQVDASYARRYEGTGLGLALCKRFVDLHGGRVGVESSKDRGSSFWVELPVDGPRPAVAVA